ncbi:MAG: Arc family DNA-binding protein [Verrucomicrobiae bacterium]
MKSILLRGIPETTLERLKNRARAHHRSLQGELHFLLTEAADNPAGKTGEFQIKTVRTGGSQNWSREAIYED